jgi:predicted MFS family arabinose efflux permease
MPSRKGATFAIIILFLINILNFYDRNVAGALVEPMRKEFHLDDTQVGLLGTAFTILYALIGVPLGRIADVWSRKRLLAGGMVIWGVLTAMAALVTSFAGLMVSRLGVGIGEAACAPTATSWIGDLVAPAKRARALALFMLGVPVGGALSYFFSGPIAQAYGWRAAMVIAAIPAFLLLPVLFFLHEPERGASEEHSYKEEPASMFSVLKIPTLWWIIASGALINFNMYAIGTFMPALLGRVHGLKVGQAGIATGILYITGGIAGGLVAGWVGDHIIHKHKNGRLVAAALISLVGAPFAYFGAMQPKGALIAAVVLWTIAYGSLNSYYGLVYSSIQDIVAPAQRGATMALYFMAMYLCGGSFGPLLTGRLSDHFARAAATAAGSATITDAARASGLQQAILAVPVCSVVLALVLYLASRTIATDIARREAAAALARIA